CWRGQRIILRRPPPTLHTPPDSTRFLLPVQLSSKQTFLLSSTALINHLSSTAAQCQLCSVTSWRHSSPSRSQQSSAPPRQRSPPSGSMLTRSAWCAATWPRAAPARRPSRTSSRAPGISRRASRWPRRLTPPSMLRLVARRAPWSASASEGVPARLSRTTASLRGRRRGGKAVCLPRNSQLSAPSFESPRRSLSV
ncbi:hypothetical protein T484DRAFT_3635459, partial [Baffinella frigidus]